MNFCQDIKQNTNSFAGALKFKITNDKRLILRNYLLKVCFFDKKGMGEDFVAKERAKNSKSCKWLGVKSCNKNAIIIQRGMNSILELSERYDRLGFLRFDDMID